MAGQAKRDDETDHAVVKITVGNLGKSLEVPCPPADPIIEGLLNRREIAIVAARPGTGKTPFVTQMMNTVAAGKPFLGLSTAPSRVLLIDVESQPQDHRHTLSRQWAALQLDAGQVGRSVDMFVRGVREDPNSEELERILHQPNDIRWKWVENLVERGRYDLLVVDTVLTFSPFKSSDEDRARELFASISSLCRAASRPAFVGTVHLRKRDRKGKIPTLLEDAMGWTEEILGSIVWSASADVRLGLERVDDERVALGGYRRGRGEFPPLLLEARLDDEGEPLAWDRCANDAVAVYSLSQEQQRYFCRIPIAKDLTWAALLEVTGAAKSSLSRLKNAAMRAGLLEFDEGRHIYRRVR
jgi:hypothetical protein